jgi:hypothetical protein
VEVGDVVFCFFVSVAARLGVGSIELYEVGGGVVELFFDEVAESWGIIRVVWEARTVFGVVEVVRGEGRFGWWSAGLG